MQHFNLLGQPEILCRDVKLRANNKKENRNLALQFGEAYFDGTREQGYGGYHYDGRWVDVAKTLISRYHLEKGSKFLDVGCAKGFLLYDLKCEMHGIEVAGLDISSYAVECAPDDVRSEIFIGNCVKLPFPDNYFDAVVSINTVHNLPLNECKQAISEICRVAKNKKRTFIQVDAYENDRELRLFQDWMLTAKTYLMPKEWKKIFEEVGYDGDYFWTRIGFSA